MAKIHDHAMRGERKWGWGDNMDRKKGMKEWKKRRV